jgi:hypothetical protein
MTRPGSDDHRGSRRLVWLMLGAALLVFAAANVHLLYVAFESQPECVPHSKEAGEPGRFKAAKSAC